MSSKSIVWSHRLGPVAASYRYRAQVPAEEVAKLNGFKTAVNEGEADIVVFSKPLPQDIEVAETAKREGAKVVVDICDDNFGTPESETYRKMCAIADAVVTGTDVMRGRLYDYVRKDAAVIGDPYEQEEKAPHSENGEVYIWFGHQRNLKELTDVATIIGRRKLIIATGPKAARPEMQIWGPARLASAFEQSNIALLPTQKGAEYKTPNRLLNAIRAGLFPVCMGHPSYTEFRSMAWVGHFQTGLRWVDAFRGTGLLDECVKQAQDYIRDRYSPKAIGAKWASFLEAL